MDELEYSFWARHAERDRQNLFRAKSDVSEVPAFSMAFQPILHLEEKRIFAYESLVRSPLGEAAHTIMDRVPPEESYRFDKACRSRGVALATKLGLPAMDSVALAVNVDPVAATRLESHLDQTCAEAEAAGIPLNRLIFELIEHSEVFDPEGLREVVKGYQQKGIRIAMDDFGAGYSGLSLLATLQPDIVKLDMGLASKITTSHTAAVVLKATTHACRELGVEVIAEGVEDVDTMKALMDLGVFLQQGFLFARPMLEGLPEVNLHSIEKLKTSVGKRSVA